MDSTFSPADYVIPPVEEAWVERRADGDLVIRWRHRRQTHWAERAAVYLSDDPDDFAAAHQLSVAVAGAECVVSPSSLAAIVGSGRPYFLVELDGRRFVVAERRLPLASSVNFRDVGGYRTADGRSVRWGKIYRSGSLAELSDEDVAYLTRLDLRLSYDLRSAEEALLRPDRLPERTAAHHRAIANENSRLHWMVTLFRLRHRMQEFLLDVYKGMIDRNGAIFAEVARLAAEAEDLPLVIHCTAGKDRTGLAIALLLLALGVPEETVVADYTLSNYAFDELAEAMKPEILPLQAFGFEEEQLRPFLLAEARTMTAALDYLRRRHGSVESYLSRAGAGETTLRKLGDTLLTCQ